LSSERFLEIYSHSLLDFEVKEVKELKEGKIYFSGNSLKDRPKDYIAKTKGTKAESEV